ncbi:MAG: ATP-binding cassette domain-containing protein [Sphingomonas sp.]|nr:ATP-binding cassette domain-containing protein [Sphingomonas sp.]
MLVVRDLQRLHLRVSFELPAGECVALQGSSGSGKTLLLRAIADLDPARGYVALDGEPRESMPAPAWRRKVCYVPAEPGWWAETVLEHFTAWPEAAPLVQRLRLPAQCQTWSVSRLSTGERQRLALVRALLVCPRILLLDEPTSALDQKARDEVELLLAEQVATGVSLLWVTHDESQARRVASRVLVIERGRVHDAS